MLSLIDARVDGRPVALARVSVAVAAVPICFEWFQVLLNASSPVRLKMPVFEAGPPVTAPLAVALFAVAVAAAVLMGLGVAPGVGALGVISASVAALLLEQQTYSNHLVLLCCLCAILAPARSGTAWSVRRRGGATVPGWPMFLFCVQICTVYGWTALSKVNRSYLSGQVLAMGFRPSPHIPPSVLSALAVVSIATEAFLAVGLWLTATRRWAFLVGVGLHGSIFVLMSGSLGLGPFGLMMLAGYILFLADSLRRDEPRTAVWDSYCSFCQRWVRVFRALDWFGVLRFVGSAEPDAFSDPRVTPERAYEALQFGRAPGMPRGLRR